MYIFITNGRGNGCCEGRNGSYLQCYGERMGTAHLRSCREGRNLQCCITVKIFNAMDRVNFQCYGQGKKLQYCVRVKIFKAVLG